MIRIAMAALLSTMLFSFPLFAAQISVSGSTSVARVMDVLAEDFNKAHPETYVAVQGVGSTAGITLVKKGVVNIGMSSRYLVESEMSDDLKVDPIAFDGLAVIVHQSNPLTNISREQLYDIYKGKITNWKQVGGPDQQIAVVTREASSGSRYSFEHLLGLTRIVNNREVSDINPDNLVVNSNSMVKTLVNHNKQAIGFISTGSVDRSVKAITFEGTEATTKNIADGKYELSRPFLLVFYPEKLNKDAKTFIEYIDSEAAKKLIEEYGYTPTK
ncbi:phosphate ABC transporter substrate-binding protein [Vibrio proteolyticus]